VGVSTHPLGCWKVFAGGFGCCEHTVGVLRSSPVGEGLRGRVAGLPDTACFHLLSRFALWGGLWWWVGVGWSGGRWWWRVVCELHSGREHLSKDIMGCPCGGHGVSLVFV
jgi:hypothetical protein